MMEKLSQVPYNKIGPSQRYLRPAELCSQVLLYSDWSPSRKGLVAGHVTQLMECCLAATGSLGARAHACNRITQTEDLSVKVTLAVSSSRPSWHSQGGGERGGGDTLRDTRATKTL